ncbi:MAG: hypothetical protein KJ000_11405 [Pirellulaceae bacterium]|nr:hypothetical protein [Pirellulaceae bacterium]
MDDRWVRNVVMIAAVIGGFLGVNVLTPMMWSPRFQWLWAITAGICIGQLNLIATWAALAPGNFIVRLPWSLLLAALMWYALVVGNRIDSRYFDRSNAILLGLILLFGLLVALIPLGIAARVFRWRLLARTNSKEAAAGISARMQFNLRHLLLSMFLLSLAMAPARLVLPEVGGLAIAFHTTELFVVLVGMAVCNVVVTIPCIWGAFAPRNMLPTLAFGWLAYCTVLTGVEIGFFMAIGDPSNLAEVYFAFCLMNLMQCATVFGVLLILRALGFRLVRTVPKVTAEQL